MSTKRLQKELKEFLDEPKDWCKAELANEDNLFLWKADIIGPVSITY
jgi:ubiquitin-protein ligase